MLPDFRYGFYPHLPERFGFRRVLSVVNPRVANLLVATDQVSLVTARRRVTLIREAEKALGQSIPGNFAELGSYRGGTASLLARILVNQPGRDLHLFDRWGVLPEPTPEDGKQAITYSHDRIYPDKIRRSKDPPLPHARKVIASTTFPSDRVHFHQGWYGDLPGDFQDEFPTNTLAAYNAGPLAFVHIDCDYYESVKLALPFVERHASPGCRVVIDDYDHWDGCRQAANEFAADRKLKLTPVTGQALLSF